MGDSVIRVVFVCLGNICRSPVAEGVFSARVTRSGLSAVIGVDSCGTAAFNVGKPPDPRAVSAAARAGYDIRGQIARQIEDSDYRAADYLIAMDRSNLTTIEGWAPADCRAQMRLLLSYGDHGGETQVPDPFYADAQQFEQVVATLETATDALLAHILAHHPAVSALRRSECGIAE